MRMRSTTPTLVSVVLAASLVVAACGDDSIEPPAADPGDVTVPPADEPADPTTPPDDGAYDHPTGADDVVVRVEQEGGFAPIESIFARVPDFLLSGDGRQFAPGPQIAIYPAPLLPNVQVTDVGEDGIQDLLALADEHGLLQDREYDDPVNIADATTTVVTVRVGGETYVHRAYALGLEAGLDDSGAEIDDPGRRQLAEFVAALTSRTAPDSEGFEPEAFLLRATPVDDLSGYEVEPTVQPWPVDDVDLASADECVEIAADAVASTFAEADQLSFFEQGDVTYSLAVKPLLPGSGC